MNNKNGDNHVYIIMGVSGCGKSAVASALAQQLNAAFLDGDFLHPRHNIIKMSQGTPLTDEDRAPWLARINDAVFAMQRTHTISLITCSALKKSYRDCLRQGNEDVLSFIYLKGDFNLIETRLKARKGHYFQPSMLHSQFATLEEPNETEDDVITININPSLTEVTTDIITHIQHIH